MVDREGNATFQNIYNFDVIVHILASVCDFIKTIVYSHFPCGSDSKESACKAGDWGLIPGFEKSPGGGNGNQLQYSCLGNFMDRGAWWATVRGGAKESDTTEQLKQSSRLT